MSNALPKPADVTVRPMESPAEFRATVDLYREVFGLSPTDPAIGPRMLAALQLNGGSVIGAFSDSRLVGFVYGFVGKDRSTGEVFHYSQTAAVSGDMQGRGIGRLLKQAQRKYVLSTGVTRMRWSYDPVRASNAYFNLSVLGALGRWFVRNLYGVDDMGRDVGHTSDRVIVDWDLIAGDHPRLDISIEEPPAWGEARPVTLASGEAILVGVPRHWAPVAVDDARAREVRSGVSAALENVMKQGLIARACVAIDDTNAAYVLMNEGEL